MTANQPAGTLSTTITYLQMFQKPQPLLAQPPREGLLVLQARRPTLSFYRFLYNTVGEPWLWIDRRRMSDERLASIVQDERNEVHVLYVEGVPAGYFELDLRQPAEVELAYFGIMPEFIGQRLGPWLLDRAVERAWQLGPERFWLHTCTLDHPKALPLYQRAGFAPYKTEHKIEPDPRLEGWL